MKYGPLMTLPQQNTFKQYLKIIPVKTHYLEIGVHFGGSLCFACMHAPQTTIVYGVDPWTNLDFTDDERRSYGFDKKSPQKILFENIESLGTLGSGRVRLIPGKAKDCYANLKDICIGFLFIDGLHTYEAVMEDSRFISLVAPGGFVAFHDVNDTFPDVRRATFEVVLKQCLEKIVHIESLLVCRKVGI